MNLSQVSAYYYDHERSVAFNLLRYIVIASVFSFPVLMAVKGGAASGVFLLLSLLGFGSLKSGWTELSKSEKQTFFWFLVFAGLALLSLLWSDDPDTGLKRFEKVLRFVLVIPCYLLVRRYIKEAFRWFIAGLVLAGPVLLLAAHLSQQGGRAAGAYNSILFGDFSILIAVTAFALAASMGRRFFGWRALLLASSVCAGYAGFLSMTRGAWLALPLALGLVVITLLTRYRGVKRWVISGLLLLVVGAGVGWLANSASFQKQLTRSVQSMQLIPKGEVSTSIGLRVVLWQAAVEHWKLNPVLGSGLGDFGVDTVALIERDNSFSPISHLARGEAHSLYFEHLAALGTVGFILMVVALFLKPGIELLKTPVVLKEAQALRLGALVVLVAFSVYGISQNWLARSSATAAYLMFFCILVSAFFQHAGSKIEPEQLQKDAF